MCENYVLMFADRDPGDLWVFRVPHCFLCGTKMSDEVVVRVHPPTAGVGVLCIDGGGIRGIVPLKLMERIRERIGLPIPFQKFFKLAFGVSSGRSIDPLWSNTDRSKELL